MYFFSGFIFHLTTRADDSHAPPVTSVPEGKGISLYRSEGCQDLVRFFALLRIKPHAPPLVRAPVNSFEFQRSEEHTSELQSRGHLVCRLLLEKKNQEHEHGLIT